MVISAVHNNIVPHRFFTRPPAPRLTISITLRGNKTQFNSSLPHLISIHSNLSFRQSNLQIASCLPHPRSTSSSSSTPRTRFNPSTKLFVSGLSFRTSEESLRNAFKNFGELIEVNLVMDKIANRPRGFAFLRYCTEEESKKAIEGMHGKFLDGRVIFVEVSKSKSELRQGLKKNPPHS
ncbi:putative RNA-binding protein (RRM superfamily) [Abeliophyllum distichum]|uniref:RNA-binding protein (RRM superfamily) n=1 Tax=Abeliophyllum distichum TaxID=126358 RepID=A0ABD1V6V3_9LAMI